MINKQETESFKTKFRYRANNYKSTHRKFRYRANNYKSTHRKFCIELTTIKVLTENLRTKCMFPVKL